MHVPEPVDQAAKRRVQIFPPGLFKDYGGARKFSGPASSERKGGVEGLWVGVAARGGRRRAAAGKARLRAAMSMHRTRAAR